MNTIVVLFVAAVALWLASLVKSAANEKKLRKANAVEYGNKNSIWLTIAHTLVIGLPVYCIPLIIRIVQEEKVMKTHFSNY